MKKTKQRITQKEKYRQMFLIKEEQEILKCMEN